MYFVSVLPFVFASLLGSVYSLLLFKCLLSFLPFVFGQYFLFLSFLFYRFRRCCLTALGYYSVPLSYSLSFINSARNLLCLQCLLLCPTSVSSFFGTQPVTVVLKESFSAHPMSSVFNLYRSLDACVSKSRLCPALRWLWQRLLQQNQHLSTEFLLTKTMFCL